MLQPTLNTTPHEDQESVELTCDIGRSVHTTTAPAPALHWQLYPEQFPNNEGKKYQSFFVSIYVRKILNILVIYTKPFNVIDLHC